jgi:hypothetical protein
VRRNKLMLGFPLGMVRRPPWLTRLARP